MRSRCLAPVSLLVMGIVSVAMMIAPVRCFARAPCTITAIQPSDDVPRDISGLMGFDGLYDAGYNGSGVVVAVVDTGINGNHTDLRHGIGTGQSLIVVNQSFVPGETHGDGDGHGTFIAGMLIGNGNASGGDIVGMVPATSVWNIKTLDDNGEGEESWTEDALDYIIDAGTKPDIVSLSLGSITSMPGIEAKIEALWHAGVVVVVAAGNEGPDYYTVNSPGTVLEPITVGASTTDDYLLSFSSEGPTSTQYYYKPEVVAFGLDIISLDVNGGYATGSGTSFSVPFIVAGISLLIDATNGTKTPDQIKAAVMASCKPLGYSYHYMEGAGLPNFTRALELLCTPSWNGIVTLPADITFPIESKDTDEGVPLLERYTMKVTVVNANGSAVLIDVDENIAGFTSVTVEDTNDGHGQFVISIIILEGSPSFGNGVGTITIASTNGTVLSTINVTIAGEQSMAIPTIIITFIIVFLAAIFIFFAAAYQKGSRAMPYNRCEIDGVCPS